MAAPPLARPLPNPASYAGYKVGDDSSPLDRIVSFRFDNEYEIEYECDFRFSNQ